MFSLRTYRSAILFCFLLFLAACTVAKNNRKQVLPAIQAHKWILVSAEGITPAPGRTSYLYLRHDSTINALALCNTVSGGYTTGGEDRLLFRNLNMTWKGCPDHAAEARYLDLLKAVNRFECSQTELRLYQAAKLLLVFRADKDGR